MTTTSAGRATGLRICLVASSRFPVCEPIVGGLEAHTHALASALIGRGHHVTLFAAPGSDPSLGLVMLPAAPFEPTAAARSDVGNPPERWMREHHAYLDLMLGLANDGHDRFDVVHNNSLHHVPVAMAAALRVPVLTTLHTPPVAWLESAIRFAPRTSRFVAVSACMARAWQPTVPSAVIRNGVDTDFWRPGPGGTRAVWSGRIVPEKAPHDALEAARRAGLGIDLAGPVLDQRYFDREVVPRLGPDDRYLGHLSQSTLSDLVGRARVAVVTPRWQEPYGLVAAEALSCGTPVAAYANGALPEILDEHTGVLAVPGDTADLAAAISSASTLDRHRIRASARARLDLSVMVGAYEDAYGAMAAVGRAA